MTVTVCPRVALRPTLDAFYDDEETFFDTARIVDWTLIETETADVHPYDEFAYVLEGTMVITSAGESVSVGAGELAVVPAGSVGIYAAPSYSRTISLGGPNPT